MSFSLFGMDPSTKETLSQVLGYGSIGLWLFAQTPQLITNYRRKNCEGLALPFLANWLAGDFLNMIGCFLTDQLEFQKYLALYFCFVDIGLVGQFWCYYKSTPSKPHHHHSKRSLISSSSTSSPRLLTHSSPHLSNIPTSSSSPSGLTAAGGSGGGGGGGGGASRPGNRRRHTRIPGSFEEMSAAAANVARAAEAVAASRRGGSSTTKSSRSRSRKRKTAPRGGGSGAGGERLEDSVTTLGGDSIRSDVSNSRGDVLEAAWEPHQRTSGSSSRHNLAASPAASPSAHHHHVLTPSHSATSLASSQSSATASPIFVQRSAHASTPDDHTPTASERGRTLTRPPPPTMVTFGIQPPTPDHQSTLVESMQHQQQGMLKTPPLLKRSGSRSLSVQRGGSGGSGRSMAGVVLMSLVGLVGVGSLGSAGSGAGRGGMSSRGGGSVGGGGGLAGRILWSQSSSVRVRVRVPVSSSLDSLSSSSPSQESDLPLLSDILLSPSSSSSETEPDLLETATFVPPILVDSSSLDSSSRRHPNDPEERPKKPPHGVPTGPEVTWQRLIGRVSAWTCTVLYLTSRMPQIWKNFTRKSTEGLSVFLFLFAFLANSLYVSSILLNPLIDQPRPESTNYILESLPYVLGSGGTLLFDSTIMIQFFIYGSSKPLPEDEPTTQPWLNKRTATSSRHRSSRLYHDSTTDLMDDDLESAPLLSGSLEPIGGGTIRPRTRSTSAAGGRSPLFSRSRSRQREDVLGLRGTIASGSGLGNGNGMGGLGDVEGLPYSPEGFAAGATTGGTGAAGSRSRERTKSSSNYTTSGENLRKSVIMESTAEDGSGSGSGREGRLIDSS